MTAIPDKDRAAAYRARQSEKVARMKAALARLIYETTSLSPMEADGSHWCKISAQALDDAREALK